MGRNCLVEYLVPECASCPDWLNTPTQCGCGIRAPIMSCKHFARMYEAEQGSIEFDVPKLPSPICRKTLSGEVILLEATSNRSYSKGWYPIKKYPHQSITNIRRIKLVNLPVSLDTRTFETTSELFEYLLKSRKYSEYKIKEG